MVSKIFLKYASVFPRTLLSAAVSAAVSEYWDMPLPDGRPFVVLEIHGAGEEYVFNDEILEEPRSSLTSDWDLTADDQLRFSQGFDYLGRMLQKSVRYPASITVATSGQYDSNATAYSPTSESPDAAGHTYLGAELLFGIKPDTPIHIQQRVR